MAAVVEQIKLIHVPSMTSTFFKKRFKRQIKTLNVYYGRMKVFHCFFYRTVMTAHL